MQGTFLFVMSSVIAMHLTVVSGQELQQAPTTTKSPLELEAISPSFLGMYRKVMEIEDEIRRHTDQYGLPFDDIPGITTYDDLKDPALARSMGEAMKERSGRGDVATNLLATSLVTNAYLLTGEQKYKTWVLEYVDAWRERALENGGLLPDNVGLSGEVGEYQNGKWYGGNYGWTWPHGFYNIIQAAIVAGANAYILSQNPII